MTAYIFDIETNGFLDELDTIHSLVLKELETGQVFSCHDAFDPALNCRPFIQTGLKMLAEADLIIGHNIIKFDIPAIKKVVPGWTTKAQVRDTLLLSRLRWPEIKQSDFKRYEKGTLPGNLIGRYSLEAWGYRLTEYKGDYKGGFDTWNPEMQEYCEQDVEVTEALWRKIEERPYADRAVELEHRFLEVMFLQERAGFPFDRGAAADLYSFLAKRRDDLANELQTLFPPRVVNTGRYWYTTPDGRAWALKKSAKEAGFKDKEITRGDLQTKEVTFNPGSRDQIAARLIELHGWEPKEFTPEGKPKVDETILSKLPWPEAKQLSEYLMVCKRIGQLSEGKEAWLHSVQLDGRIHGRIETAGAVTRRCTHSKPNLAQVPRVSSLYGEECRGLFTSVPGWVLVGADAAGLELRCLAHYMTRYDKGVYSRAVVEGTADDETDVHSLNAYALGLEPKKLYLIAGRQVTGRDIAKTFIYAFLYGAGDEKLGSIVGKGKRAGNKLRSNFLQSFPAMGSLRRDVAAKVRQVGAIKAVDGGVLPIRHKHAALNTLLQSAGAIAVKLATVLFYDSALEAGLTWGEDFEIVAHIHDEMQIHCREDIAEQIGHLTQRAFRQAGRDLGFRCPPDGDFKIGRTWAETH